MRRQQRRKCKKRERATGDSDEYSDRLRRIVQEGQRQDGERGDVAGDRVRKVEVAKGIK